MDTNEKPAILPEGEGIYCPSCGKFVGAYERCPHCQAAVSKRLPVIYIKRFAVVGSIVGVLLMWFAAIHKQIPTVKIGSIGLVNNMALVRVAGRITSLRANEEKNTLMMKIDDDTDSLSVSAFDKLKKFRKHYGKDFPAEGDLVEVTGNISISEKFGTSMFLSDPRRMKIAQKFDPVPSTIENLDADTRGGVYRVRVKVAGVRKFKSGTSIAVKDDSGAMDLTIFDADLAKIPDANVRERLAEPGNEFELVVVTDIYKGKAQLKLHHPESADSAKLLAGPPPAAKQARPPVKAVEVREELLDETVTVTGRVERMKELQFGTSIDLADDSGAMNVWLKAKQRQDVAPGLVREGALLTVTGVVSKFKDRLQVVPVSGADVVAAQPAGVAPAPVPAPAPFVPPAPAPGGTL